MNIIIYNSHKRETKRREIEWSNLLILLYGHPGNKFLFFPSNLIIFHLDFGLFSWLEIWKGKVFVLNPGRFLLSGFEWKLETLFSKVLNFDFFLSSHEDNRHHEIQIWFYFYRFAWEPKGLLILIYYWDSNDIASTLYVMWFVQNPRSFFLCWFLFFLYGRGILVFKSSTLISQFWSLDSKLCIVSGSFSFL